MEKVRRNREQMNAVLQCNLTEAKKQTEAEGNYQVAPIRLQEMSNGMRVSLT